MHGAADKRGRGHWNWSLVDAGFKGAWHTLNNNTGILPLDDSS
jgi:hypothetical protein